jgi:SAM-dependent methyltransferase
MAELLYPIISILLAGVVLAAVLSIVIVSWKNGISPMPASAPVRRAVAAEINRLASCDTVVEAGSGWGTLAFHLARHCRVRQLIGIENSPVPRWISKLTLRLSLRLGSKAQANPHAGVAFIRGDMYAYPYADADVVVCYLYPGAMKRLSEVFGEQLRPGARVISVCFALPGWSPERIIACGDLYRTKVYVYTAL